MYYIITRKNILHNTNKFAIIKLESIEKTVSGVLGLIVSYKKLWKILIDREMKKKDLQAVAGIGTSTAAKLSRNETVSMDVLIKICESLGVGLDDIMELLPGEAKIRQKKKRREGKVSA